jgi:hypothetical protein
MVRRREMIKSRWVALNPSGMTMTLPLASLAWAAIRAG